MHLPTNSSRSHWLYLCTVPGCTFRLKKPCKSMAQKWLPVGSWTKRAERLHLGFWVQSCWHSSRLPTPGHWRIHGIHGFRKGFRMDSWGYMKQRSFHSRFSGHCNYLQLLDFDPKIITIHFFWYSFSSKIVQISRFLDRVHQSSMAEIAMPG